MRPPSPACPLLLVLPLIAATVAGAAEPVRVRVDYVFSAVRLDGGARIPVQARWSVGATLIGNRVADSWEGQSGGARRSGGGAETLGAGRWEVVDQNTLMRVSRRPNSDTVVRVTVSGRACSATVASPLKPGKTVHLLRRVKDGSQSEYVDVQYSDIRCSIS